MEPPPANEPNLRAVYATESLRASVLRSFAMRPYLLRLVLLPAAVAAFVPASAAGALPTFEASWNLPVSTEPRGLTSDAQNRVYVADNLNDRILVYSVNGDSLALFGSTGSGPGQLSSPTGIASDGSYLYVADQGNARVQKLTTNGSYVTSWGTPGTGQGQFGYLVDVEVAPGGNVYTLEATTLSNPSSPSRVQRFTSQGTFVQAWGENGSGSGQFDFPGGIAIDSDGTVYVADSRNNRIQKFSPTGTFLGQFSASQPTAIDADGFGNVFAIDRFDSQVQQFKTDGTFVGAWGSQGGGSGQFNTAWDVATSSGGHVFVSDGEPRVQRFGYSTPVLPTTWGAVKSRYLH